MYRRFLSPGWIAGHLLVVLAVLVCLRLGWWQWDRSREATGTAQNLGYALLWPAFGASFIYMWLRFLQLEVRRDEDDDAELDEDLKELVGPASDPTQPEIAPDTAIAAVAAEAGEAGEAEPQDDAADVTPEADQDEPARRPGAASRAVTLSVAIVGEDDEDDPELAAYNRALAELAEKDRRAS